MEKQLSMEIRLLGITRAEMAKKAGISESTLSKWLNGGIRINAGGVRTFIQVGCSMKAIKDPTKEV